jgi:hypothetical protein
MASGCMSGTQTTDTGATGTEATTKTTAAPKGVQAAVTTTIAKQKVTAPTTTVKAAAASSALSDLAAAMSSGIGYKCTYVYQQVQATTWVKGQKFYSETQVDGKSGYVLSDGTWMYIWSADQPQGTKFNINDMKAASAGQAGAKKPSDPASIAHDAVSVQCLPDLSADSKFTVPSDIQFQDMGELLKNMAAYQQGGKIPNIPQE